MAKDYTSCSCLTIHSEDSETQMGMSINNTRDGKPMLMMYIFDKVQSTPGPADTPKMIGNGAISRNTVQQLQVVAELAKQAWEQSSGKNFDDVDENSEDQWTIFCNPAIIKEEKKA